MKSFPVKIVIVLLFGSLFQLMGAQSLRISVDEADYPYAFKDRRTGEAAGFYPLLMKYLFSELGIPTEITSLPWKRALYYGETGEAGIAGLYKTAAREEIFEFSDPIHRENLYLYALAGSEKMPVTLEDLRGKSVGLIAGWSYGEPFDRARASGLFSVIEKRTNDQNFELLKSGRVDYILSFDESARLHFSGETVSPDIRRSPAPFITNPVYLAFNRNSGYGEILKTLNELIASKIRDGSYDTLTLRLFEEAKSSLSGAFDPGPAAR